MCPRVAILALYAFLSSCAPDTQPVAENQHLLLAGRSFTNEQRYAKARSAYEKALSIDSLDAEVHFELGNLEALLGRIDAAAEAYQAAIIADPTHNRARHNLAVTEADQGRLPRAIELLEQMPSDPPALRTLPLFYAKQGRYDLAEKTLRAALAAGGNPVDIRQQLGQLYLRQGRHTEAQAELGHTLALDSTQVESRRLMGLSHLSQRHYTEALSAFQRVISDRPFHTEAHYNLAAALSALGRRDEAGSALARFEMLSGRAAQIARLRRQLDADPDHLETRLELAYLYRQLGQNAAARTHYRAALLVRPDHLETLVQLSDLLLAEEEADEALELCQRGIALHPKDIRTNKLYFAQGLIGLRRGQYHQARADFEHALALDPSSAEAWNNLGNALLALGQTAQAQRALEAAVNADPSLADAHYNLGSLFLQQGQLDQARRAYLAAMTANSTFARTYYAIATVYQAQGAIPEARQAYQTFIDRWRGDPDFLRQARQKLAQLQ
ncbi:MAG: tetratricopeptide repeat protein [Candidatus Latescibacterota bacterium]|jgi:tetratricopeptide (TPR) repeat protein